MTNPDRFPQTGTAGPGDIDTPAGRVRNRRLPTVVVTVAAAGGLALGGYGIASAASPTPSPSANPSQSDGATPGTLAPSPSAETPSPERGDRGDRPDRGVGSAGRITALGNSSVTVTSDSGTVSVYRTTSDTTVHLGRDRTVALSTLQVGDRVLVAAPAASGSTPATATDIVVRLPHLDGTVTAVAPGTVTVRDRDGFTRTIATSSATTYAKDGASATRAAVTTGVRVAAEGRVAANGTSLDASRVEVLTTDSTAGPGGHGGPRGRMGGGHGRGPGGGDRQDGDRQDGSDGTTTPSPSASPSATTES